MNLAKILALNNLNPADVDNMSVPELKQAFDAFKRSASAEATPTRPRVDSSGSPALVDMKALRSALDKSKQAEQREVTRAIVKPDTEYWLSKFVTCDTEMLALKDTVRKLAPHKYPVLIMGETGTGKELIAKALHGSRTGMFQALNCGGFPEHLIESELFGHVAGAFTGAVGNKLGLFQSAQDGTLFLDEIGELPFLMQVKLLRALQERVIRPVGAVESIHVNCRIVCATNRVLPELISDGQFREDLYWRISAFELYLKPLRLRRADIPLISAALGKQVEGDTNSTYRGNVRELEREVVRALINV